MIIGANLELKCRTGWKEIAKGLRRKKGDDKIAKTPTLSFSSDDARACYFKSQLKGSRGVKPELLTSKMRFLDVMASFKCKVTTGETLIRAKWDPSFLSKPYLVRNSGFAPFPVFATE